MVASRQFEATRKRMALLRLIFVDASGRVSLGPVERPSTLTPFDDIQGNWTQASAHALGVELALIVLECEFISSQTHR